MAKSRPRRGGLPTWPLGEFVCIKCGHGKAPHEFRLSKKFKSGYASTCLACERLYMKAYYEKKRVRDGRRRLLRQFLPDRPGMLVCTRCGKYKPDGEFTVTYRSTGKRAPWCKSCVADYDRHRRTIKRTAIRAKQRAWGQRNPDVLRAYRARTREVRRKGRRLRVPPSQLRAKWAFWAGRCWICGGVATTWDHVKPLSKGGIHCLANLRPACVSCNCSKGARWPFTLEVLRESALTPSVSAEPVGGPDCV